MDKIEEFISKPDENGSFPIHNVIRSCHCKLGDIKNLLKHGADLEVRDKEGRTALLLACLAGHYHIVKFLISEGADVNAPDNEGITAMHMAINSTNSSILLLAKAGADVNCKSHDGLTPLMLACEIGKVGAVKNLCDLGADATIDNQNKQSLIWLVVEAATSLFPSNALQMVRAIIKAGANVDIKDPETGQSVLHIIAQEVVHDYRAEIYLDTMKVIINNGLNPWEKDKQGQSPLMIVKEKSLKRLAPALKKYIKNKELEIAANIHTSIELLAFYENQKKLDKEALYDLLLENSDAKMQFDSIIT